ncbi:MAG: saccharopine dehydrogenase [Microscillaceae bacterium]|nr:saccharopine dehydrogenase [Microscillaceae bacterium]
MSKRSYDIVLFGATGFTGRLTALYLAQKQAEKPFSFALAGRNPQKLAEVQAEVRAQSPQAEVALLEARADDAASLRQMTAQAQVLLTTVGPYAQHGRPLVEACIDTQTDYLDITGEGNFVTVLLQELDEKARAQKVRIVNCCGFDSIPADFGAYFTIKQLPEATQKIVTIRGYAAFNSGSSNPLASISGGTWHSALNFMRVPELWRQRGALQWIDQQAQSQNRRIGQPLAAVHYRSQEGFWGVPLPLIDNEIVLRSAAGLPEYGRSFYYRHYGQINSLLTLSVGALGITSLFALAQLKPTRDLLLRLRPSGQGPDEAQRSKNSFEVFFEGRHNDTTIRTRVSGGDPGYGETSKMVGESALCLALDRAQLPERYGILTPVLAGQDLLLARLQKAGIQFEVVE